MSSAHFRFNSNAHEYIDLLTGDVLPHITGMLERTGWIDDQWYTEESSDRGTAVHRLTADYDLGALHVESCTSIFRAYLLGHVKCVSIARPTWHTVEEPFVHRTLRFGGRPDRDVTAYGQRGVWEVKSAAPARGHQIQTALQAILVADEAGLPPTALSRFVEYLKPNGKFKLEEHTNRKDFDEAYRVIRECCR